MLMYSTKPVDLFKYAKVILTSGHISLYMFFRLCKNPGIFFLTFSDSLSLCMSEMYLDDSFHKADEADNDT